MAVACIDWSITSLPIIIIIFDAKKLTLYKILDVNSSIEKEENVQALQNAGDKITVVRLSMNEKYLAINLVQVLDVESVTSYTSIVWTKASNFSTVSLVLQRQKPGRWDAEPFSPNLARSLHWKPAISNNLLYVPVYLETIPNFSEITFSVWDMSDGTFKHIVRKKYHSNGSNALNENLTFLLIPSALKILITEDGLVSLFNLNDAHLIWKVEKAGYKPCIVMYNKDFVGVEWTNIADISKLHLIIYDSSDGQKKTEVDLQENIWQIYEVQINSGRLAVTGGLVNQHPKSPSVDTVVYNLENGSKVFSCVNDMKLPSPILCILEKNSLLTTVYEENNEKLYLKMKGTIVQSQYFIRVTILFKFRYKYYQFCCLLKNHTS